MRSSVRGALAGATAGVGTVMDSEDIGGRAPGPTVRGTRATWTFWRVPPETSEAEGRREAGHRPQSECGEGEEEAEEDGRLRGDREHTDRSSGEDDGLGRQPAEDAAQRHEEEYPEGRERQRGRLQLDAREERRGDESPADRRRDGEREAVDGEAEGVGRREEGEECSRHPEAD